MFKIILNPKIKILLNILDSSDVKSSILYTGVNLFASLLQIHFVGLFEGDIQSNVTQAQEKQKKKRANNS